MRWILLGLFAAAAWAQPSANEARQAMLQAAAFYANEVATEGGKVIAGTKTETFMKMAKMPVHLPLSGRTMSFDAAGMCVSGC